MPLALYIWGCQTCFQKNIGKENTVPSEDKILPCWHKYPGSSMAKETKTAPWPHLDGNELVSIYPFRKDKKLIKIRS